MKIFFFLKHEEQQKPWIRWFPNIILKCSLSINIMIARYSTFSLLDLKINEREIGALILKCLLLIDKMFSNYLNFRGLCTYSLIVDGFSSHFHSYFRIKH